MYTCYTTIAFEIRKHERRERDYFLPRAIFHRSNRKEAKKNGISHQSVEVADILY